MSPVSTTTLRGCRDLVVQAVARRRIPVPLVRVDLPPSALLFPSALSWASITPWPMSFQRAVDAASTWPTHASCPCRAACASGRGKRPVAFEALPDPGHRIGAGSCFERCRVALLEEARSLARSPRRSVRPARSGWSARAPASTRSRPASPRCARGPRAPVAGSWFSAPLRHASLATSWSSQIGAITCCRCNPQVGVALVLWRVR